MPRTTSAATKLETAKAITSPNWLVFIDYSTPVYYSSTRQVTFDGHTWTPNDIQVSLSPDQNSGSIKIQNTDYVEGGLISGEDGISDIAIKVYKFYGTSATPAAGDVELLFDGVGDTDQGGLRWVTITLKPTETAASNHPFIRCTKEIGFNYLPPDGLTFSWEGEQLTLTVEE